ncbi:Cytochrome P450, conserved site,Cytochrome P450,Cytochrome P450, E-class, group I [Cinara cedri]|uniref:Cytochrome P450, conserved site,Cytochrome P450,Cytochrome P450, E-class, group I n=1 Tax=Cinara cedri TaxID=506608 RepID=A0A5E4NKW7_9HEMI|nr:Cytochrome P450, conserved site,Cytochrome P450,Cytochrome P450, E-class, group I [Cinara cedri]
MFSYSPDWWLINVATSCIIIISMVAYFFCTSTFGKWEKLNVPYARPIPLFGNFLTVALGSEHPVDFYKRIYNEFVGHKYVGLFQMRTPYLMIRDPEIINRVLIKDFSYFPDHGIYSDFSANPLSNNIFFIENPQWKMIRHKLSPAFSSSKLKLMYEQIKECGEELMKNISKSILEHNNNEMEVLDVLGKFSTDVIGTCAFGLKLNAINDDNSEFRKYGKTLFKPSLRILFRELCLMISPVLLKVIKLKDFPIEACKFFHSAFHETISYREKNNIVRNDFVQVLMQTRRDLVLNENIHPSEKLTETHIVANAFVMFLAGSETVSTALSFCLYEIALKKDIQDKCRDEIKSQLLKKNGVIDNEFLADLNYLDMVLKETLRKYPPSFALFRKAAQTYRVPNDSLVIEKGQKIMIPLHSLHYDPQYYPNPEVFDPERFSQEEKSKRQSGTYLPFGDGPRICIGIRFAEMEMKLALVEILSKFELEPCGKTDIPLKLGKKALMVLPENGIWLKFKKISS